MDRIDRILKIDPAQANPENLAYRVYRGGLKWATVGNGAIIGGLAFQAITGSELGVDVAIGGAPIAFLGGMATAAGLSDLPPTS